MSHRCILDNSLLRDLYHHLVGWWWTPKDMYLIEAPYQVMLGPRVLGLWSSWYLVTAGAAGGRTCR